MTASPYSFIDVAVLDTVRARFAAGDALAVLDVGLDTVLWANGPGAALFGFETIEAAMGAAPGLGLPARRQIMSARGFPQLGTDRPVTVRLTAGLKSRMVTFLATSLALPDGEPALLLAVPAEAARRTDPREVSHRAISGFHSEGQFAALIDGGGRTVAASAGFSELALLPETLRELVAEVEKEEDRLVKRMVPVRAERMPAGIARLTDDPPMHFLLIVADGGTGEERTAPDEGEDATAIDHPAPPAEPETQPLDRDDGSIGMPGGSDPVATDAVTTGADPVLPDAHRAASDPAAKPVTVGAGPAGSGEAGQAEPSAAATVGGREPEPDQAAGPIRFVWRTDAEGRFSAISEEFVRAVGEPAGAVVGETFEAVATRFGLDPDGEITGLLGRRDTWSGRTVLWPIAGTDLKVPVDLAALPVYGRERNFEGFRGFGIARMGDTVIDDDAIGLSLAGGVSEAGAPPAAMQERDDREGEHGAAEAPSSERPDAAAAGATVVRLAEHKEREREQRLSASERNALREIGERLRRDSSDEAFATPPAASPDSDASDRATASPAATPGGEAGEARPGAAPTAGEDDGDARASQHTVEPSRSGDLPGDDPRPAETPDWLSGRAPSLLSMADDLDTGSDANAGEKLPETPESTPATHTMEDDAEADLAGSAPGDDARRPEPETSDDEAENGVPVISPSVRASDAEDASATNEIEAEAEIREPPSAVDPVASRDGEPDGPADTAAPAMGSGPPDETDDKAPAIPTSGFLPSAFFERQKGAHGVDTAILSRLPVPILIHAGDVLHFANREFLRLTGYATLGELEAAGGIGAIFADPLDEAETERPAGRKLRLRTEEGETFPVDAHLQRVPWQEGQALLLALRQPGPDPVLEAAGTASRNAERLDLEARVAEMRTIIDTATDGVVIIDNQGVIRSISRPAEALFGLDGDEVAGKPFTQLFAIESQRAARDYLNGLSDNGVASVLNDGREVIGREAKGRFIPLFMTIGRLPNQSGYCAVVRDITQWKRAEEELTQARAQAERASAQKTEFLARVSHEIRTPLNAIIGFSELMIDEKFGPIGSDRYRDYLRDINRSGNHVLDLVNDLLDISKIEAGEQEMAYEAVSLNDAIAESVAMMQPQANRERVIIRSSFASRLPDVVADLRSVRQIVLNLLSNAIRYTQAGGQVIISTSYEASGDIVMRIRDTGVGMSSAEIEQALKPFKQVNALKRQRGDGTGLGLPLTKAMVEANRARFAISSTPGSGTLVEITFPSTRVLAE